MPVTSTQSRISSTNRSPFIARVLPSNVTHSTAIAVGSAPKVFVRGGTDLRDFVTRAKPPTDDKNTRREPSKDLGMSEAAGLSDNRD